MEILTQGHSIVLVGGWNRNIITPQWVTSSLANVEEAVFQLAIDDPTFPFRILFDDYVLTVRVDRLQLHSQIVSAERLSGATTLANDLLELLPHTPISSLGLNFAWRESDPPSTLLPLFTLSDTSAIADEGHSATETAIKRSFPWQDGILNFTLALKPQGHVIADFNFHWPVARAADAQQYLNARASEARDAALLLLRKVYNLEEDS